MAELVYALCAITSALCAVLLLRSYRQTRSRLLLWSTLAFTGLTINNAVLFADRVLTPDADLQPWRAGTALAAMTLLVVGLIWEQT